MRQKQKRVAVVIILALAIVPASFENAGAIVRYLGCGSLEYAPGKAYPVKANTFDLLAIFPFFPKIKTAIPFEYAVSWLLLVHVPSTRPLLQLFVFHTVLIMFVN
ncbi:hypothetical protein [Desulfosporosinus shakirovi]|uniref:hypothetical protein n=1 Tax=Desulfosporosinus shakirovi TaxID=2885154 RepID=UPI001E584B23|nr:hypothetical protein [Desulfosporosinus sp. SRJS8]MCB8817358.1 hypothetical protein [Desulfosporosinus sp. SRJS8]